MRLDGKVCIITGAGSGQGRAAALRFAAEGAGVVIAEIDRSAGAAVADEIAAAGGEALAVPADVSGESDWQSIVAAAAERFGGVDFHRRNYEISANTSTSRLFSVRGEVAWGDAIFYDWSNPFLGRGASVQLSATIRPVPRFTTDINVATSRFHDVRFGDVQLFDARIVRALSTLTVTDRLLLRNITEYNSFDGTLGTNLLVTYRINALTVFYAGYDDHYRQGNLIELAGDRYFPTSALQPTNRAFFTKLRVLFRY